MEEQEEVEEDRQQTQQLLLLSHSPLQQLPLLLLLLLLFPTSDTSTTTWFRSISMKMFFFFPFSGLLRDGADETKKGNNLGVGMRSKHHGVGEERERESKRRDMFGREKLKKKEKIRERERGGYQIRTRNSKSDIDSSPHLEVLRRGSSRGSNRDRQLHRKHRKTKGLN